MTRVRVNETVGGRRFDADDTNGTNTGGNDTMITIKDQFLAEADQREREHQRLLAGDFTVPAPTWATAGDGAGDQPEVTARDAYYRREMELSRMRPGAASHIADAQPEDDDDDAVSSPPGMDARAAHLQREAQRSRLPARGSR